VNRHRWVIDYGARMMQCEATPEPTDHDCAGCGAELSLDFLWTALPGTELCRAADLVRAEVDALRHRYKSAS
jgi:hypothetical protein